MQCNIILKIFLFLYVISSHIDAENITNSTSNIKVTLYEHKDKSNYEKKSKIGL